MAARRRLARVPLISADPAHWPWHHPRMADSWNARHFSLANPVDDRPTDLPYLLRRVADEIERHAIGAMELLDLTISQEMTADGPSWSAHVYWSSSEADGG